MRAVVSGCDRNRHAGQRVAGAYHSAQHSARWRAGRGYAADITGYRCRGEAALMSDTGIFNPSRLALARRRRGLTMTLLAEKIGVDLRSVSGYEKGEFRPDESNVQTLSQALRFPNSFFHGDDLEEPLPDTASFRALSKMSAAQRNTALGAGAIALLL